LDGLDQEDEESKEDVASDKEKDSPRYMHADSILGLNETEPTMDGIAMAMHTNTLLKNNSVYSRYHANQLEVNFVSKRFNPLIIRVW
jgi:hypothetical protein